MEPGTAWAEALADLDQVANLIKSLATEVHGLGRREDCDAQEFERFREELEKAETESRRVKEALRDATKAFKAAKLPPPSRADRDIVEKSYMAIKEDLAKAKVDWRESLARARAHEASRSLAAKKQDLKQFVSSVAESKMRADEAEERFGILRGQLEASAKNALALGLDKVGDVDAFVEEQSSLLQKVVAGRRDKETQATRLAECLSSYAKWSQGKLAELKACKFAADESSSEVDRRCKSILNENDARVAEIRNLKLKVPANVEAIHADIFAAVKAYEEAFEKKRKLRDSSMTIMPGQSGFKVDEPVFYQEVQFNPYRQRLADGQPVWTAAEIKRVVEEGFKVNDKGLSVGELEVLAREFVVVVAKSAYERDADEADRLMVVGMELLERALQGAQKKGELRLDLAAHLVNLAGLRCQNDRIVFKGQAIFPLLEKAATQLQQAAETPPPPAAVQKIKNLAKAVEALRKKAKNLDDGTTARMDRVLTQQKEEIHKLTKLADSLLRLV